MSITVLGDGAWGTAIANLLATNGHKVNLWCYNPEIANNINTHRVNHIYLKDIKLDKNIVAYTELSVIKDSEYIFEAIPIKFLRGILTKCKPYTNEDQMWILLSKGIENNTMMLASEVIFDTFNIFPQIAILTGPSFAIDVANQRHSAVNLATSHKKYIQKIFKLMGNSYFKMYYTEDVIGTQLCASVKNAIALLIGILDGAGYQDNTKAFILTLCLQEMCHLNKILGGRRETVYDLAGIGDLLVTTMSNKSKNYTLGQQIGKGVKLDAIINNSNSIYESLNTLISIQELSIKKKIEVPIFTSLYKIVYEQKPISEFVNSFF